MTLKKTLGSLFALVALVGLALPAAAHDGEHAHIGEPAPQFELTDVSTGEPVALSDYSDKLVVLVWQSIHCPWDKMRDGGGYQRVLSPLAEEWAANDVQFIAINSNKAETAEQVASYASEHAIPYPILKDPGNKIADIYGAQTTPHFYVISQGEQELIYAGGFEEVPTSPEKCGEMDEQYLTPVVLAALNGTELPYTETKSKGCSIKRVN
ncbi:MAG: redoxin domain-containing protein [Planctomycetota bacterium]